jgi:LuxR family maltose regulon positive regulatory protein
MPVPVLATKFFIPSHRAKTVLRPRLIERLNQGLQYSSGVILLSAPAGFGKTTLVSEWVNYLRLTIDDLRLDIAGERQTENRKPKIVNRVAWLSLDEGDSDLSRFLVYLIAALQTPALSAVEGIASDIGAAALAMLQASQPQPPLTEPILTALLNDIAAIPENSVLVLDDYHVIESAQVDQALTFLLDHLPPRMHLVIATREDPELPLARYRVRGQLIELRAADLRFTSEEAAEFLNEAMELRLSARHIAALETRTEGWIAGLQLAALSLQGDQDLSDFIESFTGSHHFVLDYLLEEVLEKQPENIQVFLLHTSMLERLCGPLCDAVLLTPAGSASGQETLEYLERANLFIVPLDNERRWYRYHRLFADLLQQRLHRSDFTSEKKGLAESHRRASLWYEQNGYPVEAYQHAVAARDFERAAAMAELSWQAMDRSFQSAAWLGWVKMLPDKLVRLRPVLSTQMAWALTDTGQLEASEARLRDAERWLGTPRDMRARLEGSSSEMVVVDEEQFRGLPARIALIRASNAQIQGDLFSTVKYAELALKLTPEEDHQSRAQAAAILGITYWADGDLESARQAMLGWISSMQKVGNNVFVIASAFALADILIEQGRLREAVRTYQQSLHFALTQDKDAQRITAHHYLGLALLFYERGDQEAATSHLQKAQELGEQTTLIDWPYRWRLAQARLAESEGNLAAALNLLEEAKRVFVRNPVPDTRPIEAWKARVYVRQGRLNEARDWARERGLSVDDKLNFLREFEHITLARVLIAEYESTHTERPMLAALRLLERLLKAAEAGGRIGNVIEILIVQALAYQAQRERPRALESLERALTLAEPEGYCRTFLDEGAPMAQLLAEAAAQGIMPEYVARLSSVQQTGDDISDRFSSPRSQPLIEPLSQRELEVLRLVAEGLSNADISKRLFLALSTVKGHNLRIFSKLQAHSRTEAVARARELGLL